MSVVPGAQGARGAAAAAVRWLLGPGLRRLREQRGPVPERGLCLAQQGSSPTPPPPTPERRSWSRRACPLRSVCAGPAETGSEVLHAPPRAAVPTAPPAESPQTGLSGRGREGSRRCPRGNPREPVVRTSGSALSSRASELWRVQASSSFSGRSLFSRFSVSLSVLSGAGWLVGWFVFAEAEAFFSEFSRSCVYPSLRCHSSFGSRVYLCEVEVFKEFSMFFSWCHLLI